jgi:hypothetical protein
MGAWCGAHLSYGAAAAGAGELKEGVREGASDKTREQEVERPLVKCAGNLRGMLEGGMLLVAIGSD